MKNKIFIGLVIVLSASAFAAAPANPSFETGTLTNWTLTGDGAFGDSPRTGPRFNQPKDGTYYADSGFDSGGVWDETKVGVLQSDNFTLGADEMLSCWIGGWSAWGGGSFDWNYVGLYRASDDVELGRAWTRNQNDAFIQTLDAGTNVDLSVYIKVIDNANTGGFAWITVDDFQANAVDARNWNFEQATYDKWTLLSGTAFQMPTAMDVGGQVSGWDGAFYASSGYYDGYNWNEDAVGVLRSDTFTMPADYGLAFKINGWSSWAGGASNYNYLTLNLASDDTELGRSWAPGNNAMQSRLFINPAASGQGVYIELVDDGTGGYSWFGADSFRLFDVNNPSFESGTYLNWTIESGTAWGGGPVTPDGFAPIHFAGNPIDGLYYANSMVGSEPAVGVLRSATFTYPSDGFVTFLIGGYSTHWAPEIFNYVVLKRASDGLEYGRFYAPNQNYVMEAAITNPAAAYVDVYVEVVDNCSSGGWAWISVDNIATGIIPEPAILGLLSVLGLALLRRK